MNETNLTRLIMLAIGRATTIFRNNTGMAWTGESKRLQDGSVLIKNPRPLHAGLCTGSSDLIGWTTVEVTPDMVGKKVAIFTAIEVKTPKGRVGDHQANFLQRLKESGGIAGVARSQDDARNIIENH